MRIRISDKSLRDGELTLEVSNSIATAFRKAGSSSWAINMDVKYLIYEA